MTTPTADFEVACDADLGSAARKVKARLGSRYPDCPEDLVDDAVGDAVAQWLERYQQITPKASVASMLYRLSEWRLLDRMSAGRRQIPVSPDVLERLDDSRVNVENEVLRREASRWTKSLYLLTARSRRVLSLWSMGYTMREISLRLHLTMVSIRKKKQRALKKLRDRLSRSRRHD